MEIELMIKKKKELYFSLMEFIDSAENTDFKSLITIFEKQEILKDKGEIISTLQLLSKIAENHHLLPDFLNKFSQIINYLIQKSEISDYEIYNTFKNNKRILLLLLEQGFILPDEQIISDIMRIKDKNNFKYSHYLYSGIKSFINDIELKSIENEIKNKYNEEITNFEEKCRIGENDSYICSLIRHDLVEEFIAYVNRTNTSLSSQIQPSIFETNLFLIQNSINLIEYASFFGSIQIVRYLRYNNVSLTNSLWLYVVHSNNAELIHFLEENEVKPPENHQSMNFFQKFQKQKQKSINYEKIFEESVICHHNAIADYIKDNFLNQTQIDQSKSCIIDSCNYYFFPTDVCSLISKSKSLEGFNISQFCFSLKKITIPSSVTTIGNNAFSDCSFLVQISIPSSVTRIGSFCFRGCSSLTQITIPSSVTSIENNAFYGCSSLTQITIPPSVTMIGQSAFEGCVLLKHVDNLSSASQFPMHTFYECKSLTQITIPSTLTRIGNFCFKGCESLTQITIPSSVTIIEQNAFEGCVLLAHVDNLSSVGQFKMNTFYECKSLTQITIPSTLTRIGSFCFKGCESLTQITIPSSVTMIGQSAFEGCVLLAHVDNLSSVDQFKMNTFAGCKSLTQITIPSTVTKIGDSCFKNCQSLTQITIPSSVKVIGMLSFQGCSIKQISIHSSVQIQLNAFDPDVEIIKI